MTIQGARHTVLAGMGVALLVGATWIGLTAATSKTYHLAPLLGAIGPGLTVRSLLGTRLGRLNGLMLGVAGALLMLGAWGLIVALDLEPTAILSDSIPGGVFGEVLIGAGAGALLSALLHSRHRAPAG